MPVFVALCHHTSVTLEEIQRHLAVGRKREVYVDVTLLESYPGVVRTVVLRRNGVVDIRFEAYGYDDGGLYVRGHFDSLAEVVRVVENYLHRPLALWENFTASGGYPDDPTMRPSRETWEALRRDIANNTALPAEGRFERLGGS